MVTTEDESFTGTIPSFFAVTHVMMYKWKIHFNLVIKVIKHFKRALAKIQTSAYHQYLQDAVCDS